MRFDPKAPPFWEQRRGGGPVTDALIRAGELDERIKRELSIDSLRTEALQRGIDADGTVDGEPINTWGGREVVAELANLGATPWRIRRPSDSRRGAAPQAGELTGNRAGGYDGNGNRWIGHGNHRSIGVG